MLSYLRFFFFKKQTAKCDTHNTEHLLWNLYDGPHTFTYLLVSLLPFHVGSYSKSQAVCTKYTFSPNTEWLDCATVVVELVHSCIFYHLKWSSSWYGNWKIHMNCGCGSSLLYELWELDDLTQERGEFYTLIYSPTRTAHTPQSPAVIGQESLCDI